MKRFWNWVSWNIMPILIVVGVIGFLALIAWGISSASKYQIVVIDHCEYIRNPNDGALTHKANCTNHNQRLEQ